MAWRTAGSLLVLFEQVNVKAPNRSKLSDGTIGDLDHQNRNSDHNPWCEGHVVTAADITHDPKNGCDIGEIFEALRESRDPRIKYLIFQGRICFSRGSNPWQWRKYTGPNAHANHGHISVQCDISKDSTKLWQIERDWLAMATEEQVEKVVRKVVREEIRKLAVGKTQQNYNPDNVNLKVILQKVGEKS